MSPPEKPRQRLLDPVDRTSEVLFGLIMALSFTCAISVSEAGREDVRTVLIGAIGCNIAWGLIDAIIYLLTSLTERARGYSLLRALRRASDEGEARAILSQALPPLIAGTMNDDDFASLREKLERTGDPSATVRWKKEDFLAAMGIFLLVFLATFPVVIPFIFLKEVQVAMRVSNAVALVMLFFAGLSFGRYANYRPIWMGLVMMLVGSLLVMLTIALGG